MTTEDKMYLKENITEYSKKSNKKVYIKTTNNAIGKEVSKILSNNKSELSGGNPWEKTNEGFSYKDFTLKFDKKDHATTFYDNLRKVLEAPTAVETPKPTSGDSSGGSGDGSGGSGDGSGSSNTLLIVAGVILLAAIGLFVWKKRR